MRYAKPEVTLVDDAVAAVQTGNPKGGMTPDSDLGFVTGSAYEADE